MSRILLFLTVLLACGFIAAGCGGDDDNGDDDSVATTETAPAAPTETEPAEEISGPADICMEQLRAQIELQDQLGQEVSDDFRSELEATCDGVSSDEDVVVALREQCKAIAKETLPGDESALQGCERIKQP